ncbi:MAG: SMP-30/gluconolactonase/LRE family protein [Gammaproteobacteria bacterium]|nr:SMP-30/gluconolactonase/LRE family protein [Gammaproteobacteria bacterium]
MKRRLKVIFITLAVFLAIVGLFTLEFLSFGGQFRAIVPRTPGECRTLALSASAEDIQIDRNRSVAYLSALDRRALVAGRDVRGTVLQVDLTTDRLQAVPALASAPADFRPHGMALYRMGDGKQRLFVISHPAGQPHSVEIFEQQADSRFAHIGTVRDPLLLSPNAIVAVGPQQFYVANDKGATGIFDRLREFAFRTGLSRVVYYDGAAMRVAAGGLKSAVGMGLSPDGLRLYVAETLGKRVSVYTRNPGSAELQFTRHIDLDGSPDNINVDGDGTLWIAVHARLLDLVRHFGDPQRLAPTTILRESGGRIDNIYVNDGSMIAAGSVGAAFDGRLYVGSITDPKLLTCRLR